MNKSIATLLLSIFALTAFSACTPREQSAARITPVPEVSAAAEATKAPEPTDEPTAVPTDEPTETPTEKPTEAPTNTPEPKMEKLDIPVYPDDVMLNDFILQLGYDAFRIPESGLLSNRIEYVLEKLPCEAARKASTGEKYLIYDWEGGYREYVFVKEFSNEEVTAGFPLVIGEVLQYDDFMHLNAGDTIDEVEKVDAAVSLYKRKFLEIDGLLPNPNASYVTGKTYLVSLHYLHDGIIKMEYRMIEDGSLVIENIVYSPDYTLSHINGKLLNYRIEPIDLPEK